MTNRIAAILFSLVLCSFAGCGVVSHLVQTTASMEPTIKIGDHVATINITNAALNPIERFDMVSYRPQPTRAKELNFEGQIFIHRVIGMPGDKFEFRDGIVYVGGEPLNETFGKIVNGPTGPNIPEFIVPEGEYVLLGDNRDRSMDARYWKKPSITRSDIVGKVTNIIRKEDYDKGKRW